jgi:hypothetical protein
MFGCRPAVLLLTVVVDAYKQCGALLWWLGLTAGCSAFYNRPALLYISRVQQWHRHCMKCT